MRNVLIFLALFFTASVAQAREGFYFGVGGGLARSHGHDVPAANVVDPTEFDLAAMTLSTKLQRSPALVLRAGYNLFGFVALEVQGTANGLSIFNDKKRIFANQIQAGARVFPLGLWQKYLPGFLKYIEPGVFVGMGNAMFTYKPGETIDRPISFKSPWSMRFAAGAEIYFSRHFKINLEYNWAEAAFNTLVWNKPSRPTSEINPAEVTLYQQLLLSINFHFGREKKRKPASRGNAAPTPSPAPRNDPAPTPTPAPPRQEAECRMGSDGVQACGYHCRVGSDGRAACAGSPDGKCAMNSNGRIVCSEGSAGDTHGIEAECRMGSDGVKACGYHCRMGSDGRVACAKTPEGKCAMGSNGRITCSQ